MLVMHFYLVCSMNKIGGVFIVCILISVTTGADELISKYKTSTTTTTWKKATTKWKEPTTTPRWKESTTNTPRWNEPKSLSKWNEPKSSSRWKEPTTSPRWKEPSTQPKWQQPTTTPRWKEPRTSLKWKEPTTSTRWKEPTISPKWKEPTTPRWKDQTTTPKWKESTTTTNYKKPINTWKSPITTSKSREPITTNKYKELATTTKWKSPTEWKRAAAVNQEVVAVASFSGLDSRNGRLSSMNGIKVFPSQDSSMIKTDNKGNFIFRQVNGKMPMPITITKQGDGVSGTIRILPGSVSVSSSASSSSSKSGPVSAVASYSPWKTSFMKPVIPMDDMYFQPFPTFPTIPDPIFDTRFPDTSFRTKMLDPFPFMKISEPSFEPRMQDPWFHKDMFKQSRPRHGTYTNNWFYPSFNPYFNYW